MEVKLVVTNGRRRGREIRVKGPKFFIGRAEDCHLRCASDLVSRHHCVILVTSDAVSVRDLGSRNGTFVNGRPASPERRLSPGDHLVVGQLDFDVRIDGMPGHPRAVTSVAAGAEASAALDAAAKPFLERRKQPAGGKNAVRVDDEVDISQWFDDQLDSSKTETKTIDALATVQQVLGEVPAHDPPKDAEPEEDRNAPKRDVSEAEKEIARRAHGGPTTQDAAAEMLKKMRAARR